MKRLIIVSVILVVMASAAYAETGMMGGGMMGEQKGEKKQQGMMMNEGMTGGPSSTVTPSKEGQKGDTPNQTQEAAEAGVTVKVTLEDRNETLKFKVALDTHTAELDKYKFAEVVVLMADGKEYRGRVKSEEGSGHHRSALIEFENLKTKEIAVVVKDVAGVKERVFKF